jgi:hypothetical protein
MTRRSLSLLLCLALLAGCAEPTPYEAARAPDDDGWSETRLEPDRWQIAFAGNAATDRATVERAMLRRAAEVTLAQGADHFLMAARDVTPTTTQVVTRTVQPRPGFLFLDDRRRRDRFGDAWVWRGHPGHARGFGSGYGGGTVFAEERITPVTRWRATAEILLARGPKPEGDPDAYDARAVLTELARAGP